ncbi:BZ3500_MvSof-1268-A1-R1_Chr1-3g02515 [Microbotryum saponariae]|uniref:BZ3500_MvSof-1268-A1-R1_Chr1-3g02515 protein n=1 Tax=Microbotryum saponariae TaxID=289078 RepID=A0A2X0KCJ5_9BASI|nr:BZ3500_MvSof-1268-A1-R1_Chr1-3g02515 [Microbotryum saponariae]SCZ96453.1 BZ3501_MvSof-1269-A2-R1_Chr1-3g02118 [Microbotryum saponariae]
MEDTVATMQKVESSSTVQADQCQSPPALPPQPAALAWHPPKPRGDSATTTSHTSASQLAIPYTTKEGVTFAGRKRGGYTMIIPTAAPHFKTSQKELGEPRKELDRSAEASSTKVDDDDVINDEAKESDAEDDEAEGFEEQDSNYQPSVTSSTPSEGPQRAPVRVEVERIDDDLCDDDSSESAFSIEEMDTSFFESIDRKEQSLIRVAVMFLMGESKKSMHRRTGLSLSKIMKFINNKPVGNTSSLLASTGKQLGRRRILEAAQEVFDREWDNKYSSSFTSTTVAKSKISVAIPTSSSSAEQFPPQSPPSTSDANYRPSKYVSSVNFKYSEQQLVTYYVHWLEGASKTEASRNSGVNERSAIRAFWEKGPQTQAIRERRKRVISIAEKQVANAKQREKTKVCFL